MSIEIRPATPLQVRIVREQWWGRLRPANSMAWRSTKRGVTLTRDAGHAMVRAYVEDVLRRATVLVAVLPDVTDLLGWVVFDETHLWYVRVPSDYGRQGIGTALLRCVPEGAEPQILTAPGRALLAKLAQGDRLTA